MSGFTEIENRIITKYISDLKLSRSLTLIRGVMESIWADEAPRIVKDYTDHGEKHSERLAYFAEKLLLINPDIKFSQQEIYLLLAGIYLHDIGMQCDIVKYPEIKEKAEKLGARFEEAFIAKTTNEYSLEEQKEIRKNHHFLSAAWIDYLYEGKAPVLSHGIKSIPYDLVDDLMDICKFHSKLSINDCSDFFTDYPSSRKKMVASLLRFADELDISSTRVRIETVKIFSIDSENSVYWWLHNYTNINLVDTNKIRIKVNLCPEDFESYGSFVKEDYITNFKNKNMPVLDVLVGQNIPLIIDHNSDVVAHVRAEKFPPEITAVLDKKIKNIGIDEISEIDITKTTINPSKGNKITNSFEYDVFICHSSKDKPIIEAILKDLKKENITCWVDAEQIGFGHSIIQKIEEGLKKSKYVIPCLSNNLNTSGWTRAEYGAILNAEFCGNSKRLVIPLKLDNCDDDDIPLLLRDKKRVTYSEKTEFNEFIDFLKKLPSDTLDLQLLKNNANSYKKSAERCLEQRLLPDGKIESPLVPAIVNLASSIEFYLKFLLAKEGKTLSEYNLLDLFKSLELSTQIEIINMTKYNKNVFELLLENHSEASVEWRNIHIHGKNKSMSVDIQFMKKLMDSLEFIVNRS
jgi:hypothetical protein